MKAIVCHDAGSANIILSDIAISEVGNFRAYMQGPALNIWNARFSGAPLCDTLESTIEGASLLISGTSRSSEVEHEARRFARYRGIRSIGVIDHWVNYAERFVRGNETIWPDEFWVTDSEALKIAVQTFGGGQIRLVPNRYIEEQLRDINQFGRPNNQVLLYVLESANSNWGRGVPGEFQALDYFLANRQQLGLPVDTTIILRPHPADVEGKYDNWIASNSGFNIEVDRAVNIAKSLGRSSRVVGCESFALVLSLMAGRTVYCSLPPWAPSCRLPHQGLIHIARGGRNR